MDSQVGWDCSLWSNQQNGIEESFMVRHEDHVLISSPIQEANSNSQTPIGTAQIVLHQQLATNSNWIRDDDFADRLCLINCSMGDFGMAPKTTTSLESLECLLSAGNSNGDTVSLEDDGISASFSENLWSFGASRNYVVSSSSGHDDHGKAINKEAQHGLRQESLSSDKNLVYHDHHDHDEVVLTTKPNSSKRSRPCATSEEAKKRKRRMEYYKCRSSSTTINFQQASSSSAASSSMVEQEVDPEAIAQMKEMIYRAAALRPVNLGMEVAERPKRKNVKISSDPQTVAARQRRERISERIRLLQKLVPGGTKMDTASMLDEAANYLKFLRSQVKALQNHIHPCFSPLVQNPPIHHFT